MKDKCSLFPIATIEKVDEKLLFAPVHFDYKTIIKDTIGDILKDKFSEIPRDVIFEYLFWNLENGNIFFQNDADVMKNFHRMDRKIDSARSEIRVELSRRYMRVSKDEDFCFY